MSRILLVLPEAVDDHNPQITSTHTLRILPALCQLQTIGHCAPYALCDTADNDGAHRFCQVRAKVNTTHKTGFCRYHLISYDEGDLFKLASW